MVAPRLGCLRALFRPHLTDEAADLQIAKDTEQVEYYKSTEPAPQRHKLAQALIDWDSAVQRLQAAKQEPSDFNKKLGLEKTFSLCQAADELKRYLARLNEATAKLTSALLRSWMEEKANGWVNAEAFPTANSADIDPSAAVLAKVKGAPGVQNPPGSSKKAQARMAKAAALESRWLRSWTRDRLWLLVEGLCRLATLG